ncbi:MAG: hypothetical protein A2W22_06955 [Candidatus Levybacteria bacterium RBG_16_35_11]|nr:MAG: hypothetical protein A2W22_06955 [Candidatus Levybacteria bacterium RBG_16_35_11]
MRVLPQGEAIKEVNFMANVNNISIKITADGTMAIEGVKQVTGSLKKMESETGEIIGKIQKHWLAFSAAAYGAYKTISQAWNMAEMYAKFEEQKASLNALASQYGMTADTIITRIQEVSQGMISMSTAAEVAGAALQKNLLPDQVFKLAEAAETLSNISGSTKENFIAMSEAIALGRERALESSIGIIDLQARYGDLTSKMSDTEKQAARYAIVMERVDEIQKRLGPTTDSTSDKMERFIASIDDLKLRGGEWIIKFFNAMYGAFQGTAAAALVLSAGMFKMIEGITWLTDKLHMTTNAHQQWKIAAEAAWNASIDLAQKARGNLLSLFDTSEKHLPKIPPLLNHVTTGIGSMNKELEKLNEQIQAQIDKLTLSPSALIMQQAEAWRKAGADKIKIQQWVNAEITKLNDAAWEANIKERLAYDEFMQKEAEKELTRQEELHQKLNELHRQEAEYKVQMYEDSWRQIMDMANQVGGEAGMGLGKMFAGMKGIMDIETGQDPYSERLDQIQTSIWDANALYEQGAMSQLELDKFTNDQMAAYDAELMQQKLGIARNTFGAMAGLMKTLSSMSKKEGEAAFKAYQDFAMGEAVISTALAIMKVFAGEGNIYVKIAQAALMAAMCAVQIANIESARPGGRTISAPSGGGGYAYTSPTEPSWQAEEKETPRSIIINYHHYGHVVDHDSFSREIIPSLRKAVEDGAH